MRWHDPSAIIGTLDRPSDEESRRAEAACRTALALAPDDTQALLILGRIVNYRVFYWGQGNESAVEPLKRAIAINPDCPDIYSELGNAYRLANRYDEAIVAYNTAVVLRREQESSDADSYSTQRQRDYEIRDALTIADLCAKTAKYSQALESLQDAEKVLGPNDDRDELIHFTLGKTYLALGDIESAKREQELVTHACRLKNKFVVYRCEAAAKELQEDIEKAR
jgi:tetratricopeptide (TPR) repeat protein